MKKIVKYTSLLVILLIVVIAAAPFFIPLDTVKKIAHEKIKEATGRDLIIAGDIKASMWPNIGVTIQNVSLSNPEGYSEKNFAEIEGITIGVGLLPLLHGDVQMNEFIISKPTINLEIAKNGTANWQFSTTENNQPETNTGNSNVSPDKKPAAQIPSLGKIKIEQGNFTYRDMRNGKTFSIADVDFAIKMPSVDSELEIISKLNFNKETVAFTLNADNAQKLLAGDGSNLKVSVKVGTLFSLSFDGKASIENASGTIGINSPSLLAVSAWAGKSIDWKGDTKLAFDLHGDLSCSTSSCSAIKSKLFLDDNVLTGDVKVNFEGKIPSIEAKLSAEKVNINHYLAQPEKQAGLSFISNAYAQTAGWDSTPIDMSGLRLVNAVVSLDIGSLLIKNATINKISMGIKLAAGELKLTIPSMELYEGTATLSASANAGNVISANFTAQKLQIEPLLKDFADFEKLTGIANMNIAISGTANSQKALMSSLQGDGKIQLNDGTIKGVDIGKVISSTKAMITGVDTSSEKTKFSELGGTFTIKQGIVNNNDLIMKAPLLRVGGEGTIDLPNRYVKYRLLPSVVATLQGQGGKDKEGLEIPVNVEGNFESLKFTPDLASVAEDALKDPQKIKDTVKSLKESVKKPEDIKNLIKGFR